MVMREMAISFISLNSESCQKIGWFLFSFMRTQKDGNDQNNTLKVKVSITAINS